MNNNIIVTIENGKVVTLANTKGDIEQTWSIPLDIDALTIEQAQKLVAYIEENATDEYKAFMSGTESIERKLWSSQLAEYSRVVCGAIAHICDMPSEAFARLSLRQQRVYCDAFEVSVIRPLYMLGVYQPKGIRSFTHNGVEYHLPKMGADGFGGLMPMAEETTEVFAESNDLFLASENPIDNMPLIVAILCRPEGEEYDERKARERAEEFRHLPMSVAMEVFFCKVMQTTTFLGYMSEHLIKLTAEAEEAKGKQ